MTSCSICPVTTVFDVRGKCVVECPPPPAVDRSSTAVTVVDFSDCWQTGYVEMRNLPDVLRCSVEDFRRYCRELHAMLVRAYEDLGVPFPEWRSWDLYVRKWPCLARPARCRVHVLKPL